MIDLLDIPEADRPNSGGLRNNENQGLILIIPAFDREREEEFIQMGVIFPEGGPVIYDLIGIRF